jgi:Fe-S oxidoreductase
VDWDHAIRLVVGLGMLAGAFAIAGRRFFWVGRLVMSGAPSPGRLENAPSRLKAELTEVLGQKKLLTWSVPGVAHFFTMWGFIILNLTIVEAVGALFNKKFFIPIIGRSPFLGFMEDFFAVAVLCGLATFTYIRYKNNPEKLKARSRFFGSHTGPAWLILFMISMVIVTLLVYRAAQVNTGVFPYSRGGGAFASDILAHPLHAFGLSANKVIETTFILLQLGVIATFLVIVSYSKHLHIFLAPINILFSRRPKGLGALATTPDMDMENMTEDTVFGVGQIQDFGWKANLDMATCTECGRCQSQCPAWNTGKPLSPKMVIMDLRDHLFAKAPYILAGGRMDAAGQEKGDAELLAALPEDVLAEAARPLVGSREDAYDHHHREGGVIDPDVLWSCTTCGACVEQCPVDIEHVDHIIDMRRYQVLIESAFPSEAGVMLRNLENNANPWGMNPKARTEWTEGLSFEVKILQPGEAVEPDVEYLYWVGCAGALEDRSKKVARAFAELLHIADVKFAILGTGESCTGDPARRLGNEYLFQELAKANIAAIDGAFADGERKRTIVATCPHCFNAIGKEYPSLGGEYDVVHHTQVLARLVDQGRLVPVESIDASITYHDPCYLGRHNQVYTPPREVLAAIKGLQGSEMGRCKERGFCCGAGGARMWMEEKIGKRINVERVDEALTLDPDIVSTACPFCITMLSDAITEKKLAGEAKETVEVLDVAQILSRSLGKPAGGTPVAQAAPEPAPAPEPTEPTPSNDPAPEPVVD